MYSTHTRALSVWLFFCCSLIACIVVVGAITRLTNSGLSMVEWRPLMGMFPPLNEEEWRRVFILYQASPEYQKVHFWMELSDFKRIFFWEWFHRFLGRMIGLVYTLPLIWFWIKGMIPQGYKIRFVFFLLLGAAQGLMGWYMVQSGLVDNPAVSHYRLAAHLGIALLLLSLLFWTGLSFVSVKKRPDIVLYRQGIGLLVVVSLTILWGAFTAGLDAGLVYNESFPKMGGHWIPPDLWFIKPVWLNIFETHGAIQFVHRWLAMATVFAIIVTWIHAVSRKKAVFVLHFMILIALGQACLGIFTLLSHVALSFAVLHQAGAVCLLLLTLTVLKTVRP